MSAINVNISGACTKACEQYPTEQLPDDGHWPGCGAAPVLVPLPLEPFHSATFTVALGECTCTIVRGGNNGERRGHAFRQHVLSNGDVHGGHWPDCPARPVRVARSIKFGPPGKEWEESEVMDLETRDETWHPSAPRYHRALSALSACCARWALIKALVLGRPFIPNHWGGPASVMDLFVQRDAVFAALAAMAQHEAGMSESKRAFQKAVPHAHVNLASGAAEDGLAQYVQHLVEQVGILP